MNFVIHKNNTYWGTVYHIITSDGKGCIEISLDNNESNTAYLSGLSVIPEVRHNGIGTALIKEAEQIAENNEIDKICLSVEKINDSLLRYYQNLNYDLIDEDDDYFYLEKQLNNLYIRR
jgi:ribosomal protein S18 acetylase RimI-like enzyme